MGEILRAKAISMLILFCIFISGAFYSYALYPVLLMMLPKHVYFVAGDSVVFPVITIIVTAHNEEAAIEKKILNTLALQYPRDKLEIVIASDASTDSTNTIVKKYESQGVRLICAEEHRGKEYAQLLAINATQGDILVFSDVATHISSGALTQLAKRFSDTKVGGVSSVDRFVSKDGSTAGEGLYVRYEMWLRGLESQRAGLVGLSGSFFAARRTVCEDWDTYSPSDFSVALSCVRKGLVAISDSDVIGEYPDISDVTGEYGRKVRTVIRGMAAVGRHREVLNPVKMGLFAFQIWSHKIMRWAVPWFLVGTLLTGLALWSYGGAYKLLLLLQLIFYLIALVTWKFPILRNHTAARITLFFVQVNMAIAHATIAYIGGRRITTWKPSER